MRVLKKSCPGPDEISYKVLSELPRSIKALVCLLISSSINNSYVPVNWKESQITMIPKQDKGRSKTENCRPICLRNCLAKVCETVVKNIVLEHCEGLNVFGETQSAHRKHRCTTDNLIKLTQHVSEAFQWSEMIGLFCLDVEKAFDTVWRLVLIHKLNSIELKIPIIKWINSFLSQRNVYVKIKSTVSASFCPRVDVPQGSVIAPILFLIYVSRLQKMKAQISQFADDFALYYRSRSTQLIQNNLQSSLSSLIDCCDHLKTKINPNKTQYMIFKNPSKKKSELNLKIKGVPVGKTQSLKFLGITLTLNIRRNDHCNSLKKRANSRLFQLWRLSNQNINEESLLLVYKSWIQPLFLYSNACRIDQSQALINKKQCVQNRVLRICLQKPRFYKVQKLHEEANMQTIREVQIKLANGYISRAIKHNTQSVVELIHKKRQCPLNKCKITLDHLQYKKNDKLVHYSHPA